MIAYEGKEPYVFVSYSHKDTDAVLPIVSLLKQKMCRVWFDEGLTPGESWNDSIADHLLNCSQFILFLSPDSIASKYVLAEINYALSKNKPIVPVILKPTELPPRLELMLSTIQFLDVSGCSDWGAAAETVSSVLSPTVFARASMPFLQDLGLSFSLVTRDVEKCDSGKEYAATVYWEDEEGHRSELYGLRRLGIYDVSYRLSSVKPIEDFFFPGTVRGSYQVNVNGSFLLEYPLYGPDVEVLLIFVLRIPRHGSPTMKLVDYQYVNSVSSLNCLDQENLDVVGEVGPSMQIKKYLEEMLYR